MMLHNDLYMLTSSSNPNNNVIRISSNITNNGPSTSNHTIYKCNMWHNRREHPSHETITRINKVFPLQQISKPISLYDTYFYAKHTKVIVS